MVQIIPQGYDNCGFIVWNSKSEKNECVVIDVYDSKAFVVELKTLSKVPVAVLSTHWHWSVVKLLKCSRFLIKFSFVFFVFIIKLQTVEVVNNVILRS